jgi:hypothetical protein
MALPYPLRLLDASQLLYFHTGRIAIATSELADEFHRYVALGEGENLSRWRKGWFQAMHLLYAPHGGRDLALLRAVNQRLVAALSMRDALVHGSPRVVNHLDENPEVECSLQGNKKRYLEAAVAWWIRNPFPGENVRQSKGRAREVFGRGDWQLRFGYRLAEIAQTAEDLQFHLLPCVLAFNGNATLFDIRGYRPLDNLTHDMLGNFTCR